MSWVTDMGRRVTLMGGQAKNKMFYGYYVVSVAFLMMVVIWGVFYTFGVFFKPILKEFGWTRAMTSGAFSLASVTMGLVGIAVGSMNDKFGPRVVMTICGARRKRVNHSVENSLASSSGLYSPLPPPATAR